MLGVGVNPGAVHSEIWRFLPQVGTRDRVLPSCCCSPCVWWLLVSQVVQEWVLRPLFRALFLSTQQGRLTASSTAPHWLTGWRRWC